MHAREQRVNSRRQVVFNIVMSLSAALVSHAADQPKYNRDIRPILADKCFACHGPDAAHREADLRLDERQSSASTTHNGRFAFSPRDSSRSEAIKRITSTDPDAKMPPPHTGKSLTAEEITTLKTWIDDGAEYQPNWAYVPVYRPYVPFGKHPVDYLLNKEYQAQQIVPAPPADGPTLVRRVYFDLLGLPPVPERLTIPPADLERRFSQVDDEFWDRLVLDLMRSPHFGERLAMFWLDLVRYADTVGYHGDQEHAAQPYRDYVIRSFYKNKPFDVFTREQLAGDLLPDAGDEQKIASCYNRLLQTSHEGGVQVKEYLTKYEADRIRNLGGVWLGATLGCAECHDHKFDPITQRDYYRFAAIFADIDDLRSFKGKDITPTPREPEIEVASPIEADRLAELKPRLQTLRIQIQQLRNKDTHRSIEELEERAQPEEERLRTEVARLEAARYRCMVTEAIEPRSIRIRARGDWLDESGPVVDAGVPAWILPSEISGRRFTRLDLADWLTNRKNPLTARVFVNRLWAMFFGQGLSRSLDDFGAQGEAPSHPELLDYLASEFMEHWDVQHLVRVIVTSQAYRRSSLPTPELAGKDPENRFFARQTAFRLPAEMIRDNALELSGLLNKRVGGAKAQPYQPDGYYQFLNFPRRNYQADQNDQQYRRGVYIHWQRQYLHPMLRAFDAPSREECTAKRPISNTPLAALTLLNDPTFLEAARALAVKTLQHPGSTDERLTRVWNTALARRPSPGELKELTVVLEESRTEYRAKPEAAKEVLSQGLSRAPESLEPAELAAWTTVCRVILNLHETITRN